jgi:REP element-mobilizing transposase RayT
MPSTHTNRRVHLVFSTKNRFPFITAPWRADLHQYLGGCARGLDTVPVQIGGFDDHVHLLLGLKPTNAIADLVREIKKASTHWVEDSFARTFRWQDGYGAFTVNARDIPVLTRYIQNQEEHHKTRTFQEEYLAMLAAYQVEYDPRYLW